MFHFSYHEIAILDSFCFLVHLPEIPLEEFVAGILSSLSVFNKTVFKSVTVTSTTMKKSTSSR